MSTQPKPTARPHIFRRKLLIMPRFQLSLLAINLGIITTISLFIWVAFENAMGDLKPAAGLSGIEAETFRRYLEYQVGTLRVWLFTALSTGIVGSAVLTLYFSHRLAGPLVRLRIYFRGITEGQSHPGPLRFRDGDYLTDLAPLINDAVGRLSDGGESRKDAA